MILLLLLCRAQSRSKSRRALSYQEVLGNLAKQVTQHHTIFLTLDTYVTTAQHDLNITSMNHRNHLIQGIAIRVASPKLVMEEAPESYKDVCAVVDTCQAAGISNKVIKLRPIAVIKG